MTCTHRVERHAVSLASAPGNATRTASTPSRSRWPVIDQIITLPNFTLESGRVLSEIEVRYRLEGEIAPARDNVVLIAHALTGTPEASEWWRGVVGDGEVLNPLKYAVLCANLLGGCVGTSGPRNDDEQPFPALTTRDQASVLARLLDVLEIQKPALMCGGSLGGMVTLEFAASFPDRFGQAVVLAAPAAQTAQGLAWHAIMRRAIVVGGADEGLALARMVGMLSYRTAGSLESRFSREKNSDGVFKINDWLYAHGEKLVQRFDARSFVTLIDAMDAHDVGRGRSSMAEALRPIANRIIGVGIPGDILFTAESVREWCDLSGADYRDLPSAHGHDAFLLETEKVSAIIAEALERSVLLSAREGSLTPDTVSREATVAPRSHLPTTASVSSTTRHIAYRAQADAAKPTRPLRIALAGCGHVGGALLDLFGEHTTVDRRVEVTRVLVRDAARERPSLARAIGSGLAAKAAVITDPTRLLDGEVDVLVELIGGTTTARTLVESALKRGIRVVTANKALLSTCGPALTALAKLHDTTLEYEGSVAAAVPVVRCLRSGAAGVGINRISGIVNGTTNVVLERVSTGESLAEAVRYAQAQGFAESDPTRDLSGEDAEDKLRVLAWLAFGVEPSALRVVRRGIDEATAEWAASVAREGDAVKLIASCSLEHGTLVARVIPERVAAGSAWSNVSGPSNRLVIESASAGALVLQGPGAGGRATAGAVYGDIFLTPTFSAAVLS
ncbi:MAG: homoserine dehydrogenase [Gemmatimonas sp.]